MVAWTVLIISALVILVFLTLLAIDDWETFLFAIIFSLLLFGAACGLCWSIVELFF